MDTNGMDFFVQLPPEIRIRIMGQMSSKSAILRIIQASPAMLAQWIQSRETIVRAVLINLVGGDIYGDLLHDALAIIHLPPLDSSSTDSIIHHVGQWLTKGFSDPFEQNAGETLDMLYRLLSRLSVFIEDYMTKATAPFPPRAYLCLPRMRSMDGELRFRDQAIDARHIELDDLTCSERNRFLRAFVRYELLCKLFTPRLWKIVEPSEYGDQVKQSYSNLHIWDYEMLHCVQEYTRSVYAAIFANFTPSWLPNGQTASDSEPSREKEFLYPDNFWTNPNEYFCNLDLPRSSYHTASFLHLRGFDILTHVLVYSESKQGSRRDLRKWFLTMAAERARTNEFEALSQDHSLAQDQGPTSASCADIGFRGQLFQMISAALMREGVVSYPQVMGLNPYFQLRIFRQRAWPFFEDARFYPGADSLCHFPSLDDLAEQDRLVKLKFPYPEGERERRRSQKWQDFFAGRETGSDFDWQDDDDKLERMAGERIVVPRLSERPVTERLIPFWRSGMPMST
ncbi:uncharacterized protein NECHADRAFT_82510 [Fusarium vanettenii 77-13-4]|uniref:Uncharacterized protein n=1 Tax=Fusarium vanettenii (strain ATCC MYA-4622 / CBS 123669 / FGSC 9596 / NRRL 45880 / 77-13-4) TaxID=660122 RepID=C7YXF4_FUSV7|nr:uncharacterized protein NECHADRAFT_82510 [Fusarium vanettenii 77-13-4]EEU43331.1 hypothetical protein NECHADRAFT_82510 [Fusarium vanettenii 77-13-4]